jgi:hypothetical protein
MSLLTLHGPHRDINHLIAIKFSVCKYRHKVLKSGQFNFSFGQKT